MAGADRRNLRSGFTSNTIGVQMRRKVTHALLGVSLLAATVAGVPTSVGYGASFGGIAALLSMLNSCASGVSVVNIDNGFGAGYQASLINKMGSDEFE